MNDKFFDIKKEKQDRMINAALKVFAVNGYRHASTDDIVKAAAISKGLLFHYFESKLGLYTFIYDYSVRYMKLELSTVINPGERDLFELMKQMQLAELHAMRGYPYMQQFLNRALNEDVSEALLAVEDKRNELIEIYDNIREQADYSTLPKGVDGQKLQKILELTARGLMIEKSNDASFQPDMFYEEIVSYIEMLKRVMFI